MVETLLYRAFFSPYFNEEEFIHRICFLLVGSASRYDTRIGDYEQIKSDFPESVFLSNIPRGKVPFRGMNVIWQCEEIRSRNHPPELMFLLSTPRGKVPFRDMRVSWHHEGNAKRCIRQFSQASSPMSLYHKFSPQTNFAANVNSKQLSAHNGWVHNPQVKKISSSCNSFWINSISTFNY